MIQGRVDRREGGGWGEGDWDGEMGRGRRAGSGEG